MDPARRFWHEVHETIAIAGIAVWVYLGAVPLAVVIVWWVRGDRIAASGWQLLLRLVLPSIAQTASFGYAIAILCTRDPARSRIWMAWQVGLFGIGLAISLAANAAYH